MKSKAKWIVIAVAAISLLAWAQTTQRVTQIIAAAYTYFTHGDRQTVIQNSDFEGSNQLVNGAPPGWQIGGSGLLGNVTASYETSTQAPGKIQSIKLVAGSPAPNGIVQITKFAIVPGDTYSFTCLAKSDGTGSATGIFDLRDKNGAEVGFAVASTTSTSWTTLTATVTVPATAMQGFVAVYNNVANSTVWFDEVSIQKTNFPAVVTATGFVTNSAAGFVNNGAASNSFYELGFARSGGNPGFPDIFGNGTNPLVIAGKSDGSGIVQFGVSGTPVATKVAIGSSSNTSTFDLLQLIGNSVRMYFGTASGTHTNWKFAAQDNFSDTLEIDNGTANADPTVSTYTNVFKLNSTGYLTLPAGGAFGINGDVAFSRAAAGTMILGNGTVNDHTGTFGANKITDDGTGNFFRIESTTNSEVMLWQTGTYGWSNATTAAGGSRDTGLQRLGPGAVGVGTGATGDFSGSLKTGQLIGTNAAGGPGAAIFGTCAGACTLDLRDTTQGADAKNWDFINSGGQLQGRAVNDANSVAGAWVTVSRSAAVPTSIVFGINLNTQTLFTSTDTIVGRATSDTLTNKRITPRAVLLTDATSITPTSDTADINTFSSSQAAGTLTVNAPSGTPTDGQKLMLRLKATNAQTYSFNATYHFSSSVSAPTTLSAGKTDYIGLVFNAAASVWDVVAVDQSHTD